VFTPSVAPPPTKKDSGGGFLHSLLHPDPWEIPFMAATPFLAVPAHIWASTHSAPKNLSDAVRLGHIAAAPIPAVLAKRGPKRTRGIATAAQAAGSSPIDVAANPWSSTKNLGSIVKGVVESPFALAKSIDKYGMHKTMTMLYHSIKDDYQNRYGKDWEKHARQTPLFNLADAFMVLGPALKGAAIAKTISELGDIGGNLPKLAATQQLETFGKTFAEAGPWTKVRIAAGEAKRPGIYTEGRAATRHLEVPTYEPTDLHPGQDFLKSDQPYSPSALRQNIQRDLDALAKAYPDLPVIGAKARVTRAAGRDLPRTLDRITASILDAGSLKGLPKEALTRLFWEAQTVKHTVDDAGNITFDHAATSKKLQDLRDFLHSEYNDHKPNPADDPQLADWLRQAKQYGFGGPLLKRLDAAIKYKPDARYERAIGTLRQATKVGETIIHDSQGFKTYDRQLTKLWDRLKMMGERDAEGRLIQHDAQDGSGRSIFKIAPEFADEANAVMRQIHQVEGMAADAKAGTDGMLHNRRGLITQYLNSRPVNAPERAAWRRAMVEQLGWDPQAADDALAAADGMARSARPENPESFWRDAIGSPKGMSPSQLAHRANQVFYQQGRVPDFGDEMMIQRFPPDRTWDGEYTVEMPDSSYFSRAQRAFEKAWGDKEYRQAGQVAAAMKEASPREYADMNLEQMFFEQYGKNWKNAKVSKWDFMQHIGTPLNRLNIRETHYINTSEARFHGYQAQWGGSPVAGGEGAMGYHTQLLSREPGQGEYHEITFEFPDAKAAEGQYEGKAYFHWEGKKNVVGHVRFQVWKDAEGVKRLLVEEVQTDWAQDYAKQSRGGKDYLPPDAPEQIAWHQKRDEINTRVGQAHRDHEAALRHKNMRRAEVDSAQRLTADPYGEMGPEDHAFAQDQLDEAKRLHEEASAAAVRSKQALRDVNEEFKAHMKARPPSIPKPPMSRDAAIRLGVNRILRYAAENDVDEVLIVDPAVQHARNMVIPSDMRDYFAKLHDPNISEEEWRRLYRDLEHEYQGMLEGSFLPGQEPLNARVALKNVRERLTEETPYTREYKGEIQQLIEKHTGMKGEYVEKAYLGHLGTEGGFLSKSGKLPAYVVKMTEEGKAKALEADYLFQKQPEWGKLPRGANEMLANKGQRLIHLFQKADISTWIHELSHSAVWDLSAEDRSVLSHYYGEGKRLDQWDNAAHENFARDFEWFVRQGAVRVPRAVQAVFERIRAWMQRAYRQTKAENPEKEIPQEVQDVFQKMLFPESDTPDIFMPHRAASPDLTGARMSRGVPRATRTVGDFVPSTIPLFAKNNLGLLRSGLINDDPRLLIEHVNRLVGLQKANQLREFLLENSRPYLRHEPPPDFEHEYIIKTAGTNPNKALYDAIESAETPSDVRSAIKEFMDENVVQNRTEFNKAISEWRGDQQLYVIDKRIVDMLFRQVTGRKPGAPTRMPANVQRVMDTGLNSIRALLLYANPGFYVANAAGNFGMMMFNDPVAIKYLGPALKEAVKASEIGVPGSDRFTMAAKGVDPVFQRVATEMGRGPTAGGLAIPEKILGREGGFRARGRGMQAVENIDYRLGRFGHGAGAIVDDAFRVAAWRREAEKLGYKSDADVTKLLDQANEDARKGLKFQADSKAIRDLRSIRDKAEQLMLDFDSMSPFERDYLARIIFLYPFLKASAKYPVMYAGEHPFTFGATMAASNQGQQFANQILGPPPDLPAWAQGYARTPFGMVNVGSIDQLSMLSSELQSALSVAHGQPPDVGINRPFQYLHPGIQLADELLRRQNRYGRESSYGDILRTDFPAPAWLSAYWRQPSDVYSDKSKLAAFLRSLRLVPFGVNQNYGAGG
jgi:hypothetical protein